MIFAISNTVSQIYSHLNGAIILSAPLSVVVEI